MQSLTLKFLTLILVAVVTLGVGLFACTEQPSGGPTGDDQGGGGGEGGPAWTGPKITILVKLLADASNLALPQFGVTNTVYIAGSLSNFRLASDTNKLLSWWDPKDLDAEMTYLSNDSDGLPVYGIVLANDLTNNLTIQFKFVNGTIGYGGDWANVEKDSSGGEIGNRSLDIEAGVDVTFVAFGTSTDPANAGGTNGVQKWAGVGPTYPVSSVIVTLIKTNVNPQNFYAFVGGTPCLSKSGTNIWGNITLRDDELPVLVTNIYSSIDVIVTFTQTGFASFTYKLQGSADGASWTWENNPDTAVFIKPGETNVTNIANFNGGW